MAKFIEFLQKNMIWEVFIIMLISIILGNYYHNFFIRLKPLLPICLFLMLYKPMTFLRMRDAFAKRTSIKTKYLILLTLFYIIIFPITSYVLMKIILGLKIIKNPNLIAGIIILTLSPMATSAPAFVAMSKGKVQLSLVGVIYTFLLSLVVIPIGSKLILQHIVNVPIFTLLKSLIYYLIIPLIIGQTTKYIVIRFRGKEELDKLKTPLEILVMIGLFTMISIVFGINGIIISKKPQIILYGSLIMNLYFLVRWGMTYLCGKIMGIPLDQNIALTYSSTYNMTISTAIGIATFGPMAAVGTVIGGPFAEMIQMILLVKFFDHLRGK